MSCKTYILKDAEVTTVCSVYLRIETASKDLRVILGGLSLEDVQVTNIVDCLARIDVSLFGIKPLIKELIELQGEVE